MISYQALMAIVVFVGIGLVVYGYEAFYWLRRWTRKGQGRSPSGGARVLIHLVAIGGVLAGGYAATVEPRWVEESRWVIKTPKLKRAVLKVAQISDLHCEEKKGNEEKIVRIVNGFEPDIIVFTGDALNTPRALPLFQDTLRKMRAKIGKYAVGGNWDAWAMPQIKMFVSTGFEKIDGKTVPLEKEGEAFFISGIDINQPRRGRNTLARIPREGFSLLLAHFPDQVEELKDLPVDLYLSGHTHGGQVGLPFYGAVVVLSKFGKKYESGLSRVDADTLIYVHRGVGMAGGPAPRLRFFARPEVALFTIEPERNN